MEIQLQHGTGGIPAYIMVSKRTTVKELKKMVKDKVGVDLEDQVLFAAGRKMEEGRTMDELGVEAKQGGRTRRKEPGQMRILPYTCKGTIVGGSQWKGGRKKTG